MTVDCFLDSNIVLYAAAGRKGEEDKRARSMDLIRAGNFGTSAQVLQEFYVNATLKIAEPLDKAIVVEWIETLCQRPVAQVDAELVRIAIDVSNRFQVSYWDGAILAAAESLGAAILYTEDLNAGQIYGGVRAVNPFFGG
jgi:predicted nucleic acid-binding protein